MDSKLVEAYSVRSDVQESIRLGLEHFSKQNITTQTAIAESVIIQMNTSKAIVNDLLDETLELEDKVQELTAELDEYKSKHGPLDRSAVESVVGTLVPQGSSDVDRIELKRSKLQKLLVKQLERGRMSM